MTWIIDLFDVAKLAIETPNEKVRPFIERFQNALKLLKQQQESEPEKSTASSADILKEMVRLLGVFIDKVPGEYWIDDLQAMEKIIANPFFNEAQQKNLNVHLEQSLTNLSQRRPSIMHRANSTPGGGPITLGIMADSMLESFDVRFAEKQTQTLEEALSIFCKMYHEGLQDDPRIRTLFDRFIKYAGKYNVPYLRYDSEGDFDPILMFASGWGHDETYGKAILKAWEARVKSMAMKARISGPVTLAANEVAIGGEEDRDLRVDAYGAIIDMLRIEKRYAHIHMLRLARKCFRKYIDPLIEQQLDKSFFFFDGLIEELGRYHNDAKRPVESRERLTPKDRALYRKKMAEAEAFMEEVYGKMLYAGIPERMPFVKREHQVTDTALYIVDGTGDENTRNMALECARKNYQSLPPINAAEKTAGLAENIGPEHKDYGTLLLEALSYAAKALDNEAINPDGPDLSNPMLAILRYEYQTHETVPLKAVDICLKVAEIAPEKSQPRKEALASACTILEIAGEREPLEAAKKIATLLELATKLNLKSVIRTAGDLRTQVLGPRTIRPEEKIAAQTFFARFDVP